jgi:hypothetical protein
MFIEYTIKFEQDGVTITQRVEPSASGSTVVKPAPQNSAASARSLGSSFTAGKGGGGADDTGPGQGGPDHILAGGGGPGAGPIVILGPIIMGGSNHTAAGLVSEAKTGKGGGGADDPGPGSGGDRAGADDRAPATRTTVKRSD